jgi:phage tail-like protein
MPILRDTPYGAFAFQVTIDGFDRIGFTEVSGLDQEVEVILYREGADPLTPRLIPGLVKPARVTLKRGLAGDAGLQKWMDGVKAGAGLGLRRTVRVDLMSETRDAAVQSWRLIRALPVRLEGPHLDAGTSAVAIETLVLAAEAIEVE